MAGARTRLVWVQDQEDQLDFQATKNRVTLMALDSEDAQGERAILPEPGYYTKPLITPKGDRVVFTDFMALKVQVINWDGTDRRSVVDGYAAEVWLDPKNGQEWVYVQNGPERKGRFKYNPLYSYLLDNPSVSELVWNKTAIDLSGHGTFQVSADGTKAGGLFPWPEAGVADLPNQSWKNYGNGCWTAMAPDNSYRFWKFDGLHRNLRIVGPGEIFGTKININHAPGIDGYEVYHPRWSNHERFFAMTGPYKKERIERGMLGSAGPFVEVYLGKFNEKFSGVETWLQITRNDKADFFPDVWIDPGNQETRAGPAPLASGPRQVEIQPAAQTWPGLTESLVFLWQDGSQKNEIVHRETGIERAFKTSPRGHATFGRYHVMDLSGAGAFVAEDINQHLLSACQASHQLTIEITLAPAGLADENPAHLVSFSSGATNRNFALVQQADKLVLLLRHTGSAHTSEGRVEVAQLTAGKTHHLVVAYQPGRLTSFLDGRQVAESDLLKGDFSGWTEQKLLFGDSWSGGTSWSGQLDGIALYSAALRPEQALAKAQLNATRLKSRTVAEKLIVQARLTQMTTTPTPQSIAPYRRCLVVHSYEVEKVLAGNYDGKKLMVAHWGILDGQVLGNRVRQLGASHQLTLERLEDHLQLESERLAMDSEEFDLTLYYDRQP